MRTRSKSGSVTSAVLIVLSAGTLGVAGYNMLPSTTNATRVVPKTMPRPGTAFSARGWLGVLGLDAEALAAAGVTADGAGVMASDLQAYMDENGEAFVAAIGAYNAANKQASDDDRMVQAGKGADEQTLAANKTTASAALANRTALFNGAFDAATAHFTDNQKTLLATIRSNADREVPPAYCLVSRTDPQWITLREGLTAEQQASARGGSLAGDVSAFLATVRAEEITAAALARSSTVAAIRAALNQ